MKKIGQDGITTPVFVEEVSMFNRSTKSIVRRATMWLASAMLLWPVPIQQSCGCEHTIDEGHQKAQTHEPGGAIGSCCHASRDREAAGKPRTCCCCKSTARDGNSKTSCCRKTATVVQSYRKCCCGPDCKCHLSDHSSDPADNAATTCNETNRRIEFGQPLRAVAIAVNADTSACRDIRVPDRAVSSTAIDRCRELSRFTI